MCTDKELKKIAYFEKYGKQMPQRRDIIDKSKGRLFYEGREIMEAIFPLIQHRKKELILQGENKDKFLITY